MQLIARDAVPAHGDESAQGPVLEKQVAVGVIFDYGWISMDGASAWR